jgi:hypothetical protein
MEWTALLSSQPVGLALPALMAVELYRRLHRGDLVLGREHQRLLSELETVTKESARMTREQREAQKEEREALLTALSSSQQTVEALMARLEKYSP